MTYKKIWTRNYNDVKEKGLDHPLPQSIEIKSKAERSQMKKEADDREK